MADAADDDYFQPVGEKITFAMLPRFPAALSLVGSGLILREIFLDWRQEGGEGLKPTSRILLEVSIADILFSTAWLLTTLPAPKELDYIWGNMGNTATCTAQGFINQLGWVTSPLFNVTLAWFYLLMVRYNWTDSQLRRVEPYCHVGIWIFGLVSAIYPIPMELYNSAWQLCWIESHPVECLDSYRYGEEATCTRGDNAWFHSLAFSIFPCWLCVFLSFFFMGSIYSSVRQLETRLSRYAGASAAKSSLSTDVTGKFSNTSRTSDSEGGGGLGGGDARLVILEQRANRDRSHKVATQAMLYITAFLLCYVLDTIGTILYHVTGWWSFWFDVAAYFLAPLQGFLNFLCLHPTKKKHEITSG